MMGEDGDGDREGQRKEYKRKAGTWTRKDEGWACCTGGQEHCRALRVTRQTGREWRVRPGFIRQQERLGDEVIWSRHVDSPGAGHQEHRPAHTDRDRENRQHENIKGGENTQEKKTQGKRKR